MNKFEVGLHVPGCDSAKRRVEDIAADDSISAGDEEFSVCGAGGAVAAAAVGAEEGSVAGQRIGAPPSGAGRAAYARGQPPPHLVAPQRARRPAPRIFCPRCRCLRQQSPPGAAQVPAPTWQTPPSPSVGVLNVQNVLQHLEGGPRDDGGGGCCAAGGGEWCGGGR